MDTPHHSMMTPELFQRLSEFIYDEIGIKMPPAKQTMLETRLARRLKAVELSSYQEYFNYLKSPEGKAHELAPMIDVVTTNKTDFFREPRHFDYLVEHALPDLIKRGAGVDRPLMVWSAACSSGEEPYTLAMVIDDYRQRTGGTFTYMVLGTDVSTRVLENAKLGIYDEERVQPVPERMLKRYLMRSRDKDKQQVRIVPELRALVRFRRVNFMDRDFGLREKMDVIFCRNVLIYFDRPTQEAVINRLCAHLVPGGYLFTGHSETINGLKAPLASVANTISRRM